ncbi:symmetrical bis(5'-nucleosyl)-tetraphosphatase [Thalassotalea piscium]|uniref:bis(5'-nucleosyl)-tetraphosphatase (symmetrical) n=1 Tax=Thalassotalea piscium TaxID=1230533 RepID=A0A7X0TS34_9GAMM|nr:symmetrical bis(5'-nucleosyl)-tetraphosphatase [Thalassotalea piscium]MBB6541650.1 bis(5'-nucleosyl)-tetraphosphatase (symmetrical) [Thalassotalea piscium]
MATYFVGDIQGCFQELIALLGKVNFNPHNDQLWVAGDMVARGPDSLATIEFLMSLGDSVKAVLGNHDLHLLAVIAGHKKVKEQDKLAPLLASPNLNKITNWLAQTPLLRKLPNECVYMSHAGISPQWSIKVAEEQALLAQQKLSSAERDIWLNKMYGEQPNSWGNAVTDEQRFRYTINAFTRMRYCYLDGSLEFNCKEPPEQAPSDLVPWFQLAKPLDDCHWLFGHWAALQGKCSHKNAYALDTGCVWGEHLTLLHWENREITTQAAIKNVVTNK